LTAVGSEAERTGNIKRLIGRGRASEAPRVLRSARRGSGRAVRSAIIGPVILIQALGGVKRRWRQAEGGRRRGARYGGAMRAAAAGGAGPGPTPSPPGGSRATLGRVDRCQGSRLPLWGRGPQFELRRFEPARRGLRESTTVGPCGLSLPPTYDPLNRGKFPPFVPTPSSVALDFSPEMDLGIHRCASRFPFLVDGRLQPERPLDRHREYPVWARAAPHTGEHHLLRHTDA
jgi:hypothetical protein